MDSRQEILISKYIHRELSEAELEEIRQLESADPSFAEEMFFQRQVNELFVDKGLAGLKEKLQKGGYEDPSPAQKFFTRWKLFFAATLLLLAGAGVLYFWKKEKYERATAKKATEVPVWTEVPFAERRASKSNSSDTPEKTEVSSLIRKIAPDQTEVEDQQVSEAPPVMDMPRDSAYSGKGNISPSAVIEGKKQEAVKPCQDLMASPKIKVNPSCRYRSEGEIMLQHMKPGYTYMLQSHNVSGDGHFGNLKEGTYILSVKNDSCCVKNIQVIVPAKECSYEYAFAPDQGEQWEIPEFPGKSGNIKIFNREGRLIYVAVLSKNAAWSGKDQQGQDQPSGMYPFIIEFISGGGVQGQVTIFR
jgi:hypothetical protein